MAEENVAKEAAKAPAAAAKTAGGKLAAAAKKVPPVVWVGAIGGGLVLGFIALRRNESADSAEAMAEAQTYMGGDPSAYGMSEDGMSYIPAGVGVSTPVIPPAEGAETVGAIGQTALETFGTVFGTLFQRQAEFDAEQQESWRAFLEKVTFAQAPRVPPNAHQPVPTKPGPQPQIPRSPAPARPKKPPTTIEVHGKTWTGYTSGKDRGLTRDKQGREYREFLMRRTDGKFEVWGHFHPPKGAYPGSPTGWKRIR